MSKTFCTYYDEDICRSCVDIEVPLATQLARKEERLRGALTFLGNFVLAPTVASPAQNFRNKAKWIVMGTVDRPVIGLPGKVDPDDGRALLNCPITHPRVRELGWALPDLIREFGVAPYSIGGRTGELKAVIIFYSPFSREIYLRFVLRSHAAVARLKKMVLPLQARFADLQCISANIQPVPQAILEGPEEIILSAGASIRHAFPTRQGSLTLALAPQAFVQTNTVCSTNLYQCAADWISEIRPQRLLELYCGQGAFSFFAAPYVERGLGIEINPAAVASANETAKTLGYAHLEFRAADATKVSDQIGAFAPDAIVVNPPRRGLGETAAMIAGSRPLNFFYSSCSVDSLAQDLRIFAPNYEAHRAQIFDLFPHTPHFETLVWLKLRKDSHDAPADR